MGYAAFFALVLVGVAISGAVFFACGIGTYLLFEWFYGRKLGLERQKAFDAGRRSEQDRRAKEIKDLELPNNKYEAEDAKTYAEGLAGLYPEDSSLKEAIENSRKLKEKIGGA